MVKRFRHFRYKRRRGAKRRVIPRELVNQRASRIIETYFTIFRYNEFILGWAPRSNPIWLILNTGMNRMYTTLCKYTIGIMSDEHVVLKIPYWRLVENKDYFNLTKIDGLGHLFEYIWINTDDVILLKSYQDMYPIAQNRIGLIRDETNYMEKILMTLQRELFSRVQVVEPLVNQMSGAYNRMYFPYANHILFSNLSRYMSGFTQSHSGVLKQNPDLYADIQAQMMLHHARPDRLRHENMTMSYKEQVKVNSFNSIGFGLPDVSAMPTLQ
jgi:hypothetical protein